MSIKLIYLKDDIPKFSSEEIEALDKLSAKHEREIADYFIKEQMGYNLAFNILVQLLGKTMSCKIRGNQEMFETLFDFIKKSAWEYCKEEPDA